MQNIVKSILGFISGGSKVEATKVKTVLTKPAPAIPAWITALEANPLSYFGDELEGAKVVSAGGTLDGSEVMVLAHVVSYHDQGRKPGCPLFALTDDGKEFAWIAVQPQIAGRFDPDAYYQGVNPATGKLLGDLVYPDVRLKFKLSGKNSSISSWTAIAELEAYLEAGDGRRRELLVLMQLSGKADWEKDSTTGVRSTSTKLQMVSGWVVLEMPCLKEEASLEALGGSPTKVVKPATGKAKKAVLSETLAQAAVRGELPAPSPIATGDDL